MPTGDHAAPAEADGTVRARDLMTTDVLTVSPGMPVEVLARLLAERHVSGVPVSPACRWWTAPPARCWAWSRNPTCSNG